MNTPLEAPLLALDATGDPSSAAIVTLDGVVVERSAAAGERAGGRLHSLASEALAAARLSPKDLRAVVVARGPGSFTGLRVGIAAAAGLARALGVAALGVETTTCVAVASGAVGGVGVVLDGGQGRLFVAVHRVDETGRVSVTEPVSDRSPDEVLERIAADEAVRWLVRGRSACGEALRSAGVVAFDGPLAAAVARLGREGAATSDVAPLYLREPAIRAPEQAGSPGARRRGSGRRS